MIRGWGVSIRGRGLICDLVGYLVEFSEKAPLRRDGPSKREDGFEIEAGSAFTW